MSHLSHAIEALLFIESKPLTVKKMAKACQASEAEVKEAVRALQEEYDQRRGGMTIISQGETVQMMSAPQAAEVVRRYLKDEETGELTQPSLETLTIIAYRGPVAKSEIELIRGVNCSLILRNLLIRGLVEETGQTETGTPIYRATFDFLRFLGVDKTSELPHYEELNQNVHLQELLEFRKKEEDFFESQ